MTLNDWYVIKVETTKEHYAMMLGEFENGKVINIMPKGALQSDYIRGLLGKEFSLGENKKEGYKVVVKELSYN